MLTTIDKVLFLQQVEIFRNLSKEALHLISELVLEKEFNAGEVIFEQDAPSDSIYLIKSGSVQLASSGKPIMVLKEKDHLGIWSVLAEQLTIVKATAIEDSLLLKINRDDFFVLLSDYSEINQSLVRGMALQIQNYLQQLGKDIRQAL